MPRTSPSRVHGTILTIILAMTLAALLTPLVTPDARAAGSTTVTGKDGVRYDSCRDYSYTYTIDTSSAVYWDADVTLFDPEGSRTDSDFLYDGSDPASGRGSFFICDYEPAGKYKVTIAATLYDSNYNNKGRQTASDTFTLRKPRTKTSYTVSDTTPRRGQVVRVRITSKIERPAKYAPNRYEYVALEGRRNGKWTRIKGTKTFAGSEGVASLRVRKASSGRISVRAVTLRTSVFASSSSPAKTIG